MCEYTKSTVNKSTWKYLDYRMKVESTAQEGLLTMRWYPGSSWCTVLVYPHDILVRLHNTLHIVYHYLCTKYCSLDTYCIIVLCLQVLVCIWSVRILLHSVIIMDIVKCLQSLLYTLNFNIFSQTYDHIVHV